MPRFEIHIMDESEVSTGPLAPNEPTPEVRSVITTQEAANEAEAVEGAWRAWDAKYGPQTRPLEGAVNVSVKRL